MLDRAGGIQWPFAGPRHRGVERRLFEDGHFHLPDGRARFLFEAPRPLPEPSTRRHPFTLLTGRGSSSQWHTQTRTRKSAILERLHPREVYVEINPADARRLSIVDHQWVEVTSQRGTLVARAFLTNTVRSGQVFIPMHYSSTNRLTFAAFDPYSRQPAYKACAVDVRPARQSSQR
jgi:assimilatory nitrate reductase catalytic subunit